MRPRKYYVSFPLNSSPRIIEGSIIARKANCSAPSFKTRLAAEVFAAWTHYEMQPPHTRERYVPKYLRTQRTSYYRPGEVEPYLSYGDPPPRYEWET